MVPSFARRESGPAFLPRNGIGRYYALGGADPPGGSATEVLDLISLYEYLIESRERFLAKFRQLGWEEATKEREATWGSMRGIFVHMLEMEDSWLHYDIPRKPWPFGDRDPSSFTTFEAVEAYHTDLSERTRTYLQGLTEEGLAEDVVFDWAPGKASSSVSDVLLHAFIDEVAHLGELICLMWQMDVKPPHVNWIAEHIRPAD